MTALGDWALANVSIQKVEKEHHLNKSCLLIEGHVRIRTKHQGLALALGDKLTLVQMK